VRGREDERLRGYEGQRRFREDAGDGELRDHGAGIGIGEKICRIKRTVILLIGGSGG
jgi:hypothetical protein